MGGLQKLVNQEARLTLGAFRTTNYGALSMESGLRPASTQLDNRLRRFAPRRSRTRPKIRDHDQKAHRNTARQRTGCPNRNPVAPEPPATRSPVDGQTSRRRTGRSRVAQLHGPAWHSQEETLPAPEIPRQLQAQFLGEKWTELAKTSNTARAPNRNRWHEPTSASPPVTASSRWDTASPASTFTGPRDAQAPRTGGVPV